MPHSSASQLVAPFKQVVSYSTLFDKKYSYVHVYVLFKAGLAQQ